MFPTAQKRTFKIYGYHGAYTFALVQASMEVVAKEWTPTASPGSPWTKSPPIFAYEPGLKVAKRI